MYPSAILTSSHSHEDIDTSALSLNDTGRLSEWKLRCPLGGPKYKHEHEEALVSLGRTVGIFSEESSQKGWIFRRAIPKWEFPFPHRSDGQALSFATCFRETQSDRWSWRMLWDCWCDAT